MPNYDDDFASWVGILFGVPGQTADVPGASPPGTTCPKTRAIIGAAT